MLKRSRKTQNIGGSIPQKGSALIIALVFLLAMTLIGTTAIQGTSQQEKMAGNTRDRNLAFQAAEAALREGGNVVLAPTFAGPIRESVNPTDALVSDPTAYNWTNVPPFAATVYASALNGVSAPPSYIIRFIRPLGSARSGSGIYRVTARGQGGTTDAVVVLQTTVVRP